jgi:divalent metal cation (Fe/Co/Zn/Cd) transporter
MGSETDIRHAISLRPSPFHTPHGEQSPHRIDLRRAETTPVSGAQYHLHHPTSPDSVTATVTSQLSVGHSTACEPVTPPPDGTGDPIARHVLGAAATTLEGVDPDLEGQRWSAGGRDWSVRNDPYRLSEKIKSAEEIEKIKANTSRKRGRKYCAPLATAGKVVVSGRKLQNFYESQNENIERLLKPVDDHRKEAKTAFGENELRYKIAVNGSLVANLLLAGLQLYAAASSKSLALFTTMADALFDPLSNLTLILSHRAINRVDGRRFPSGKARIETAANIAFCFIMTAVSLIIIVESIRDLVEGSKTITNPFHLPSVIAVGIAFSVKLSLFLYCFALRNLYSQIRILWEDHRNDLIINGTGLMFSLLGSHVRWWIDPAGAIMISCLIIFLWLRTAHSEFLLLIGVTAETNILQLITYICKFGMPFWLTFNNNLAAMTHSPDIAAIDTVRAYYSGPRLIVEVDIVMRAEDSLRFTHDTAEDLQMKLESLPDVERAYVHVDYETSHAPEHFLKKEL